MRFVLSNKTLSALHDCNFDLLCKQEQQDRPVAWSMANKAMKAGVIVVGAESITIDEQRVADVFSEYRQLYKAGLR